eukprot:403368847
MAEQQLQNHVRLNSDLASLITVNPNSLFKSQSQKSVKYSHIPSHGLNNLAQPKVKEKIVITTTDILSVENLRKELDELKSEFEQKQHLLEHLQSELLSNQQQSHYLEQAEQQTLLQNQHQNNLRQNSQSDVFSSNYYNSSQYSQNNTNYNTSSYVEKHKKSFNTFQFMSINSMKSFTPFMSLRVSITGNDIEELSDKMRQLIDKLDKISTQQDEEDYQIDVLKQMKQELTVQKKFDHVQLTMILPNVKDMSNTLQTFEHAKFINQTRVNTAMNGINKCKSEMNEFNANKAERLIQKRQELIEQEAETQEMRVIMETKEKQLEIARKKLAILKKENDSIKIDDIIAKFFEKRNHEEDMLNKLEILNFLQQFMNERRDTNDFAFEDDIKSISIYKFLYMAMTQSIAFKNKVWPQNNTNKVSFISQTKKQSQSVTLNLSQDDSQRISQTLNTRNDKPLKQQQSLSKHDSFKENPKKKREKQGEEQTRQIKLKWSKFKNVFVIDEAYIISQYEEVMIMNQLLNVSFDDMTTVKNKRKLLMEHQLEQLQKLKDQFVTSSKFISEDNNSQPESYTNLLFLYEDYVKLYDLKLSTKLDKVRQAAPQMNFYKLSRIVQQFMDKVLLSQDRKQEEDLELLQLMQMKSKSRKLNQQSSPAGSNINVHALGQKKISIDSPEMNLTQDLQNLNLKISNTGKSAQSPNQQVGFFKNPSIYGNNLNPSYGSKTKKNQKRQSKKKYSNHDSYQENMLFSKVQEALRDYLNTMVHMDYMKVMVSGIEEMISDELQEQEKLNKNSLSFIPISQNMEFNNRGLKPREFYKEYQNCQKLFQIKPRNKEVKEYHDIISKAQSKPLLLFESRIKQKIVEIDENAQEDSFSKKQHRKVKEDIIKNYKDKELAIIHAEEERKRLALITPSSLRLMNNPAIKFSPNSKKKDTFKDINSILQDFQKNEMKFLNKFVKECDDASLKIGRFTAAVMPPTEKIQVNMSKDHGSKAGATFSSDNQSTSQNMSKRSTLNSQLDGGGTGTFSKQYSEMALNSRTGQQLQLTLRSIKKDSISQLSVGSKTESTPYMKIQQNSDSLDILGDQQNLQDQNEEIKQEDFLEDEEIKQGTQLPSRKISTFKLNLQQSAVESKGDLILYNQRSTQNSKKSIFIENKVNLIAMTPQHQMKKSASLVVQNQVSDINQENNFFSKRMTVNQRRQQKLEDQKAKQKSVVLLQDMLKAQTSHAKYRTERQFGVANLKQVNTIHQSQSSLQLSQPLQQELQFKNFVYSPPISPQIQTQEERQYQMEYDNYSQQDDQSQYILANSSNQNNAMFEQQYNNQNLHSDYQNMLSNIQTNHNQFGNQSSTLNYSNTNNYNSTNTRLLSPQQAQYSSIMLNQSDQNRQFLQSRAQTRQSQSQKQLNGMLANQHQKPLNFQIQRNLDSQGKQKQNFSLKQKFLENLYSQQ